jgi:hypothetical protein
MIVVGDHQPPAAVSGRDAPWRVPVHVIAGLPPVVDRLVAHGFRPGLEPRRPSIGAMHALVPMLLDAFGRDEGSRVARVLGCSGSGSQVPGCSDSQEGSPGSAASSEPANHP